MATKTEDGKEFPAGDYCYVPDASAPSTWKLRTTSVPGGDPDPAIVGAAAAALGPGFRGQKVQIPSGDRARVVACVRRAWHEAHPDLSADQMPSGLRMRADDVTDEEPPAETEARSFLVPAEIEVRDASKREVDMRLLPWGMTIDTMQGPERFERGAFDDANPEDVYLYGPEHEMKLGLGQDGTPKVVRVPVGRAKSLSSKEDGPHATFRVARTAAGDEALSLMADKIISGVSVEFAQVPGGTVIQTEGGRRVRVHQRARLVGATPTHRPAYGAGAAVLAVRSNEETAPMGDSPAPEGAIQTTTAQDAATEAMIAKAFEQIEARAAAQDAINQKLLERLEQMGEQARASFSIPNAGQPKPSIGKGEWVSVVLKLLSGERIPQEQLRSIEDVITTDNAGVVPPAYLTEIIGVIDASRPFLSSTRRLPTPSAGMKLIVPKITQRPQVGVQSQEKGDLASRPTKIEPVDFDAVTIGGVGDLSLQILKRSSPEFLALWLELLGEAYSIEAEDQAILALADAMGGFGSATSLDPEDLKLGDAYMSAFDAIRRGPDTIWLSTEAVGAFIDAKASTTNQPLYSTIQASATAAGGITGTISGLRAVHVPTLDAHGAYAIVGPSSGFAWAEDGTYTLQVDVPAKAGRDVALVSILWPAPWYPAAFTAYNVAS